MRVHQVGHDGLQGAVPLAGGPRARAGVGPELTHLLVLRFLTVVEGQPAARRRVLHRETEWDTESETWRERLRQRQREVRGSETQKERHTRETETQRERQSETQRQRVRGSETERERETQQE